MIEGVLPETMPGLELATAFDRIGIPAQVFKTILLKFAETNNDKANEIKQCLDIGDIDEVARLAHGLKGASANIGADALHERTVAIGLAIKNGDSFNIVSAQVDSISVELNTVLDSLSKL